MREKKATAQAAILDRIAQIAHSANATSIRELAEAFNLAKDGDFSKAQGRNTVL